MSNFNIDPIVPSQYVIRQYHGPSPLNGLPTQRRNQVQTLTHIAIVLGTGILLAALSKTYTSLRYVGLGIIGAGFAIKMCISKIDNAIVIDKKDQTISTTRLAYAAQNGNRLMVKFLLFLGANPNTTYQQVDLPALHSAISGCVHDSNEKIVEDLLQAGANVSQLNQSGYSPLSDALNIHHCPAADRVVKTLLQWGANPKGAARPYEFALYKAAFNGKIDVIKELVQAGADVNQQTKDGETALIAAIKHVHVETVRILMDLGADRHIKTAKGQLPLSKAQEILKNLKRGMVLELDSGIGARLDPRSTQELEKDLLKIIDLLRGPTKARRKLFEDVDLKN